MDSLNHQAQSPTVRLPQGLVVGITSKEAFPNAVEAFKGIPYALPPTGPRRFRPPIRVTDSQDTIDASQFRFRAPAKLRDLLNYDEGTAPKFHRVIIESGAPTSRAVRKPDAEIHEAQFKDFLEELACPSNLSASEVFNYLRTLPTTSIAKAQAEVFQKYNPSLRWAFQPVIDNEIIRGRPIDAWRTGRWHKVPIMASFLGNEGSLYVNKKMASSSEFLEFWKTLLPQLSDDDVQAIDRLYPDPNNAPDSPYEETRLDHGVGAMYKRIEAAYAHYAYVAPVRQTAFFASQEVPVYLYHWALRRDIVDGARHGDNMLFEVKDPKICAQSRSQEDMSSLLHAYITSFVCTGSPNTLFNKISKGVEWKPYDRADAKIMLFGRDNTKFIGGSTIGEPAVLAEDEFAKLESDFWWSKVELSQQ